MDEAIALKVAHILEVNPAVVLADQAMERDKFYGNVYYVNDHGNVDLLDGDGNTIKSRV